LGYFFFNGKTYWLIFTENGKRVGATFWAIFSQTRLLTLVAWPCMLFGVCSSDCLFYVRRREDLLVSGNLFP
jgi:hypothetical protein